MQENKTTFILIGGMAHGEELDIHEAADSVDVLAYSDEDDKTRGPKFRQTYTRRTTEPDLGINVFGFSEDDDITIDALARHVGRATSVE